MLRQLKVANVVFFSPLERKLQEFKVAFEAKGCMNFFNFMQIQTQVYTKSCG